VAEDSVVIDIGIRRQGKKIKGDIDDVKGKASLVTPVPGGIGPLTLGMLARNVVN